MNNGLTTHSVVLNSLQLLYRGVSVSCHAPIVSLGPTISWSRLQPATPCSTPCHGCRKSHFIH